MSYQLSFVPIGVSRSGPTPGAGRGLRIEARPGLATAVELWYDGETLVPASAADQRTASDADTSQRVAVLFARPEGESHAWYLVRHAAQLVLNGETPTRLLARLEPGALLAVGPRSWNVTRIWSPVPVPAPRAVADKKCPHCGGPLRLARVVQCLCGRYTHLERPKEPDDPDALNCYLQAGSCGGCGREASLQTQLVPEPPAVFCDESLTLDVASMQEPSA